MMFADGVLEARGRTLPSSMCSIRAENDAVRSTEFKRPSAIEFMSTGLMTLFTVEDSALPAQSLVVPRYVSVRTIAVDALRWAEKKPGTFNEMVATTPLDRLIGRLRGYKLLGPNWNGYGGQHPSSDAVEDCVDFLRSLNPSGVMPKPMVAGDGEVGVFWETDALYIEVSFRGDDFFEYLVSLDGNDVEGTSPLGQTVPALADNLTRIPCS